MSSAADLNPSEETKALTSSSVNRPRPLDSLVASAQRLRSKSLESRRWRGSSKADWQEDAWDMYDLVGEQRFLATTLAGRLSQARFYIGRMVPEAVLAPEPVEDEGIATLLDHIGYSDSGKAQMIYRLGLNLFIVGEGWMVGIPPHLDPSKRDVGTDASADSERIGPEGIPEGLSLEDTALQDLSWYMLSTSEVSIDAAQKEVVLALGGSDDEKVRTTPDEVYMIRVWRPHPRRSWESDSPTRSSLPVLRELVGLTMHISAQVDSRLAGAGLLLVPQSAIDAIKARAGLAQDSTDDPFTEALIEAMLTPISDRANASALVPLVIGMPDDAVDKVQYLTFAKPLDVQAKELRDESIRRLALGQDAPPELLLGVGGMNHWGAWLVREDVVTTHLEPPLALICDALTTQYLWPVLEAMGMAEENIREHVVWYDVSHMIMRPNRASDAMTLHDKGALSDEALRDASGFDESDAPETDQMDAARQAAYEMVRRDPSLIREPGLRVLVEQLQGLIDGSLLGVPAAEVETTADEDADADADNEPEGEGSTGEQVIPDTADDDMPEPREDLVASGEPRVVRLRSKTNTARLVGAGVAIEPSEHDEQSENGSESP